MSKSPKLLLGDALECTHKFDLIRQMCLWLQKEHLQKEQVEHVTQAVLEREMVLSTALGFGVALPHAKCSAIDASFLLVARLKKPVDFEALDGVGVDLVFLALSPEGQHKEHIRMIGQISRFLNTQGRIDQLRAADDLQYCLKDLTHIL